MPPPKKILIVDDDVIGLELLQTILFPKLTLMQAHSCAQAYDILKLDVDIPIILCNISVGPDCGLQFLQNIKNEFPKIKRGLIYSHNSEAKATTAVQDGLAYQIIAKPWNPLVLMNALDNLSLSSYFSPGYESFCKKMVLFKEILHNQRLESYFQPIAQFAPFQVYGQELFTHGPADTKIGKPEILIDLAHNCGLMLEFERAARVNALQLLKNNRKPKKIFLNNCPSVIMDADFESFLLYDQVGLKPGNIVIEIVEGDRVDNLKELAQRLKFFKSQGFEICVDDVGKGNWGLYLLTELKPDYAKIDIEIIRDISFDKDKMDFVSKIVDYGQTHGIQIIAEGVETIAEFQTIKELGINHGQGYLFSRPQQSISQIINIPK